MAAAYILCCLDEPPAHENMLERRMLMTKYDVIIVGAGFTGISAARELEQLGYQPLVLEARDRIGGRAWTDEHFDRKLEMGGAYVHWMQPHLWTELTRFGLDIYRVPHTEKVYWVTEGKVRSASTEEYSEIVIDDIQKIMAKANEYLEQPFKATETEAFLALDHMTIPEFFAQFDLTEEQRDIFESLSGINTNGPVAEGAITQLMRWWVFAYGNRPLFADIVGRYKVKGGISQVVEAMAAELKTEIKLSTVVSEIQRTDDKVTVITEDGSTYQAKTAIVTVPYSTLKNITFTPGLSATKREFIQQSQVARGLKSWILLKGKYESLVTYAPMEYPFQSIIVDDYVGDNTLFVGFGNNGIEFDPNDKRATQEAIRLWLPDAEIIDVYAHNWATDRFSLESWPMLRPNQLTKYIKEMRRPEHNLFIAGTTYARGFAGFFDGAIESGITTARKVHQFLQQ